MSHKQMNLEIIIEAMSRASGLDPKDWLKRAFPEHAECPKCEGTREFRVSTHQQDEQTNGRGVLEILLVTCPRCNTEESIISRHADGTITHVVSH